MRTLFTDESATSALKSHSYRKPHPAKTTAPALYRISPNRVQQLGKQDYSRVNRIIGHGLYSNFISKVKQGG